jgi:hypothetical protein
MQWFNLLSTRTRRLSIFQHNPLGGPKTRNLYLFPAMLGALILGMFVYRFYWSACTGLTFEQLLLIRSFLPEDFLDSWNPSWALLPANGVCLFILHYQSLLIMYFFWIQLRSGYPLSGRIEKVLDQRTPEVTPRQNCLVNKCRTVRVYATLLWSNYMLLYFVCYHYVFYLYILHWSLSSDLFK